MISSSSIRSGSGKGRLDGLADLTVASTAELLLAVVRLVVAPRAGDVAAAFSLAAPPTNDRRLVDERLNEKSRENRRSVDGGEVIPRPATGVSIAPHVNLSSSRLRLRVPRNLSRIDLPVSNALKVTVLLSNTS